MPTEAAAEFFEADPASRWRLFGVLFVLCGAGFVLLNAVEPWLYGHLKTLEPCAQLQQMQWALWVVLVLPVLPALLLVSLARKVRTAGQFPLSNRWLLRRTRISRGRSVQRLLVLIWVVAAALFAFVLIVTLGLLHYDPLGASMLKLGCAATA